MPVLRRDAFPRLWPWALLLLCGLTVWIVVVETTIRPQSLLLESTPMWQRLNWWLLPPAGLVLILFGAFWLVSSVRAEAAELQQQQVAHAARLQLDQQAAAAAAAKAHQQFSLEIRSVGITVERFRQMGLWQQLDKVNQPQQSILSQNPNDYEWAADTRRKQYRQRANNAFENALRLWVERWPIPVLVSSSEDLNPNPTLADTNLGAGLGIHMYTALGVHQGEGSDVLVQKLFQYFDEHPQLPAVLLLSVNTQEMRDDIFHKDARFVPEQPDAMVAILLTRTDRVDQYIRPYTVDVPYKMNKTLTEYDTIKLWNFFFKEKHAYTEEEYKKKDSRGWQIGNKQMPSEYWNEKVKTLISQIDPNASQGGLLPFWNHGKAGFQPSPWVPVRWTKWQLEDEYDRAPIAGHLHRPVEVALTGNEEHKAAAMAAGWTQALATLPDGAQPQWLFYDTGADGKQIIPFSRAMSSPGTPQPMDISDAAHSYNLSTRIGDTGTSSPFVQLGLGAMRSYHKGGVSATVNLRQKDRASIIMVSPPTDAEKARNKPNAYNSHYPNSADPFVSKIM